MAWPPICARTSANAEGGVDEVVGADEYLARIDAMDLPSADFNVAITQIVQPRDDQVMAMVEVHASRGGRTLHNFATHLFTLEGGVVAEWWMVEALPGLRATPSGPSRGAYRRHGI